MATTRDPWLDNAKMVLVTIVVIGHMIVLMPSGPDYPLDVKSRAYDFIYYFHIPAFVMLTGYLSKRFSYTRRHLGSLLGTLVLPYIVFSWLMVQFRHVVGGEPLLDPIWTNPRWPMWYLIVLVWWRLLTPLLRLHWAMVPASIAVSLVAGSTNQELFDLNRTLGLLPFFVIGLHLRPEWLALVRRRYAWVAGLAVFAGIWWLTTRTDDYWSTQFLFYRASYAELGVSLNEGMWIRARLILVALAGTAAVLSWVPHRRSFLSTMGAYSLVVYLCHGFVVRYLEYQDYQDEMPGSGYRALAVTVALAVALALFLAWTPVARVLNLLVDPIGSARTLRAQRTARSHPAGPNHPADPDQPTEDPSPPPTTAESS